MSRSLVAPKPDCETGWGGCWALTTPHFWHPAADCSSAGCPPRFGLLFRIGREWTLHAKVIGVLIRTRNVERYPVAYLAERAMRHEIPKIRKLAR